MPVQRYANELIVAVLLETEAPGAIVRDILRRHGIPERTYHNWRRRYATRTSDELNRVHALELRVRALERTNRRLERELRTARHLLGKPWRRSRPGARPSDGQSSTPE